MEEGSMMSAAKAYENISKNIYNFSAQKRNGEKLAIQFRFFSEEFTHVVGLDHLPSVKVLTENKAKEKRIIFKKILKGTFNENNLKDSDLLLLSSPVSKYINPLTNKNYTIEDRIRTVTNINQILKIDDDAFIYKNWNSQHSKLRADYVLSVKSKENPTERIYFFAFLSDDNRNKKMPINVNVFSVFADSSSLTIGHSKPYAVISESIIPIKSPEKEVFVYNTDKYDLSLNVMKFQLTILQDLKPNIEPFGTIAVSKPKEISISVYLPFSINKLKTIIKESIHKIKSKLNKHKSTSKKIISAKSKTANKNAKSSEQSRKSKPPSSLQNAQKSVSIEKSKSDTKESVSFTPQDLIDSAKAIHDKEKSKDSQEMSKTHKKNEPSL